MMEGFRWVGIVAMALWAMELTQLATAAGTGNVVQAEEEEVVDGPGPGAVVDGPGPGAAVDGPAPVEDGPARRTDPDLEDVNLTGPKDGKGVFYSFWVHRGLGFFLKGNEGLSQERSGAGEA